MVNDSSVYSAFCCLDHSSAIDDCDSDCDSTDSDSTSALRIDLLINVDLLVVNAAPLPISSSKC